MQCLTKHFISLEKMTTIPHVPDKVEVNLQSQELHFEQDVNRMVHPFRMIISGPSMSG